MVYSIGEIAAQLGVASSAIRYYEKEGLIRPERHSSGRRVFDSDIVRQITFITRARAAGLGIGEIRRLIALASSGEGAAPACDKARAFAERKIAELDRQIEAARQLRERLAAAAKRDCHAEERCAVLGEL